MFSGCRDHRSDIGEGLGTVEGTERARDFHAHLHHAQVLFSLVVVEGDGEVGDETQNVVLEVAPAEKQIVPGSPGFSTSGVEAIGQRRLTFVEGEPLGDDALVNRLRQFGLASVLSFALEAIGSVEQRAHRLGSRLLLDLFDGLEFAQVMGAAQGMGVHYAHMGVVGFPVIMNDRSAVQEGWNITALGAEAIMREGEV
jgi:hypothetical protein